MHKDFEPKDLAKKKAHFIEEVGEALKELGKCERFGPDSYKPGRDPFDTNIKRLASELRDVGRAARRLRKEIQETFIT